MSAFFNRIDLAAVRQRYVDVMRQIPPLAA